MLKIRIVYDNESYLQNLQSDWGFAVYIRFNGKEILFDTGANGSILMNNMKKLKYNVEDIDTIVISHKHWDHVGGLNSVLEQNNKANIYIPSSFKFTSPNHPITRIKKYQEIADKIYSTGELQSIEQSLVIDTVKGLVIIVGCSHSRVKNILDAAKEFGKPYALIGGLHDFKQFEQLEDLDLVCPTHCTQHKSGIKELYPEKFKTGGAGRMFELKE